MTLPTEPTSPIPEWATDAGTRVAPSSGQIDSGFLFKQIPPSSMMNFVLGVFADWLLWLYAVVVDLDTAVTTLDEDKLARDGSNTITGDILPEDDASQTIGSDGVRLDRVFCYVTSIKEGLLIEPNAVIFGEVEPDSATGQALGRADRTKLWDLHARDVKAATIDGNRVTSYANDATPNDDTALISPDQNKSTLACGVCDGGTALSSGYNVASITHVGTGLYEINLHRAVPNACAAVVTPRNTGEMICNATIASSGTKISIQTRKFNAATPAFDLFDMEFSFAVIGPPRALVTSPIP